ncbi:MAG: hypothetical protein R6W76_10945 [Caldilinea sp.]
MLGAHAVGRLAADAEQSLHKLAIALPKPPRVEMERLSEVIRFDLDEPRLAALQQAIGEQRVELSALRRCAERILAFPASQLCWSSDSPLGNFH